MIDPPPAPGRWLTNAVGVLWLTGADRLAFLHRLTTNRMADLAPGQGRSTVLLTDAGRVVDWLACHHAADGTILLTSHPDAAPAVAAHLARYVLRDAVRITDATAQVVVRRLFGPAATTVAAALVDGADTAPAGAFLRRDDGDATTWALRHAPPWPDDGWDIVVPAGAARADVADACRAAGLTAGDDDDEAARRIAHRVPRFGAEIDGTANPLELGLVDCVDFAKGCYVGQEVVARLDSYDKVQRRLVAMHADGPLAVGDALVIAAPGAAAPAGRRHARARVTSVAADGAGGANALAVVPAAWLKVGASVVLERTGAAVRIADAATGAAAP